MTRMLSCLLCLVGLATSALAQDAPREPASNVKPDSDLKHRPNSGIRVLLRFVDEGQAEQKRSSQSSRVGVIVDRPVVIETRVVKQDAVPGFWIGVQLAPVPPALQAQLGLKPDRGLLIVSVMPGSPAAGKTALKPFDILLAVNGAPLANQDGLTKVVQAAGKQKTPVRLTIIRGGQQTTVEITPARRETAAAVRTSNRKTLRITRDKLKGLRIEGNVTFEEIEKKIRILTGKDGQRRFELHIDTGGKDGKTGRFTRSIRISPEGIIVTSRQPAATTKPSQGAPQKAAPRFEFRLRRSGDAAPAGPDTLSKKLEDAFDRIERLEATVKALQKQADK